MIPFSKLLAVLNHPFDEVAGNEAYAAPAPVSDIPYRADVLRNLMVDARTYDFACALRTFSSTRGMQPLFILMKGI